MLSNRSAICVSRPCNAFIISAVEAIRSSNFAKRSGMRRITSLSSESSFDRQAGMARRIPRIGCKEQWQATWTRLPQNAIRGARHSVILYRIGYNCCCGAIEDSLLARYWLITIHEATVARPCSRWENEPWSSRNQSISPCGKRVPHSQEYRI